MLHSGWCAGGRAASSRGGAWSSMSEQSASADDRVSQILWRRVRAKVLARRGEFAAAERLARDAVQVAGSTDYLDFRADALMDLAEVLILAKRRPEGLRAGGEALRLYEAKANIGRRSKNKGAVL